MAGMPADHPPEPAQLQASSLQAQWLRVPVCGLPSQMRVFLPSWLPGKMAHKLAQTSRTTQIPQVPRYDFFQGKTAIIRARWKRRSQEGQQIHSGKSDN